MRVLFVVLGVLALVALGWVLLRPTLGSDSPPEDVSYESPAPGEEGLGPSRGIDPPVAAPPEIAAGAPPDEPMMAPPPFGEDETHRDVPIYFATNRAVSGRTEARDPTAQFLDQSGPLTWGTATVSIPRDHRMGHLESQSWLGSLFFEPDEEKHVILQEMTLRDREAVLALIGGDLARDDSVLVYVHGFNTSLDLAARRAGQLTYDLAWQGPSLLFAWPSAGQAIEYFHDRTMADRSVPALEQTFRALAEQEPGRIIVIAHSMGTYITSTALANMIRDGDPAVERIATVILAAPDIDEVVFRDQIAPRFRQVTRPRVTLYASAEDTALKASKAANGFRRIGDTTDGVTVIPGIDVIDATGVISDFFGHTYFGDNATILTDIHDMVNGGLPIDARPHLAPMPPETVPPAWWRIVTD